MPLFKIDEPVIAGISGLVENPLPFLWREKTFTGQLPIEKVHLLPLVAIGLHLLVTELRHALEPCPFLPHKAHKPPRKSLHHGVMGFEKRKDHQ